jgi:hypothetical protein
MASVMAAIEIPNKAMRGNLIFIRVAFQVRICSTPSDPDPEKGFNDDSRETDATLGKVILI